MFTTDFGSASRCAATEGGSGPRMRLEPTTVQCEGTSRVTTAFAPTVAPRPMRIAPAIRAGERVAKLEDQAVRLLIVAGTSTFVAITISLLRGPEDPERLKEFYLRVRPPGFWGPLRSEAAPGMKVLPRLKALVATYVTLMSFLVGFGSLLIQSPYPAIFQNRWIWIAF